MNNHKAGFNLSNEMNIGDLISHNDSDGLALAFASATDETISALQEIQHDPMEFEDDDEDDDQHGSGHFDLQSGALHYQIQTPDSLPSEIFNLDQCIEELKQSKYLPLGQLKHVCEKAKQIISHESTMLTLSTPITICGDIHGQYADLLNLFKLGGEIPDTNYLFLGDYVDRGPQSIETISLLLCYKIKYPNKISLLRGNHESRIVNQLYGFLAESLHKYSDDLPWRLLNEVFDHLPLCATIDKKVFCVHGGLSPTFSQLNQIANISRFQEIPFEGLVADLLWSDPHDMEGFYRSTRGCGYLWGSDVSKEFCATNGLELIVRAHQLTMQGFEIHHDGLVVTLFSAPNYMRRSGNQAAILVLKSEGSEQNKQFIQFNAASSNNLMDKTEPSSLPSFFL